MRGAYAQERLDGLNCKQLASDTNVCWGSHTIPFPGGFVYSELVLAIRLHFADRLSIGDKSSVELIGGEAVDTLRSGLSASGVYFLRIAKLRLHQVKRLSINAPTRHNCHHNAPTLLSRWIYIFANPNVVKWSPRSLSVIVNPSRRV